MHIDYSVEVNKFKNTLKEIYTYCLFSFFVCHWTVFRFIFVMYYSTLKLYTYSLFVYSALCMYNGPSSNSFKYYNDQYLLLRLLLNCIYRVRMCTKHSVFSRGNIKTDRKPNVISPIRTEDFASFFWCIIGCIESKVKLGRIHSKNY